jgi:ethanolamine utilization cobalamin adenosyltransferase
MKGLKMKISLTNAQKLKVAQYVVGWCAGAVAYDVLKNNTTRESTYKKMEFVIGALILSSIADRLAEREVKRIADDFSEVKQKREENEQKEAEK